MSRLAQTIRFLVGLAMVAGGVTLATPLATRLVATVAAAQARSTAPQPVAVPGVQAPPPAAAIQAEPAAVAGVEPPPPATPAFEPVPTAVGPAFVPRADYRPPQPPDPMPPLPAEFARPEPRLGGAYRSTLDVPPPPLLDASGPPPLAVAWSTREVARPVGPADAASPQPPATYRVRDGDDLAGIASRFYGHPAAAAGIWSANRHTVSDPNLLPIGAELVLPPPWELGVGNAAGAGGPAIVPAAAALPGAPATATAAEAAPAWLTSTAASTPASVTPPSAAAGRAASVRVGPGETLATLAARFYGDASFAGKIFEANRDRLRSPDLVVPGMELRLP